MKKFLLTCFSFLFIFFCLPPHATAQYNDAGASLEENVTNAKNIQVEIMKPESLRQLINQKIGLSVDGKSGDTLKFGDILSALFPYLFVFGGIILFVMLIWGGFEMLANPLESKSQDAGKQRILWAGVGFIALFSSYWIGQILEIIFGINIFKN